MFVKQISVFLENKPGKLSQVTDILEKNNIDIKAISIADTTEFGILRMIVDKPKEAVEAIKAEKFPVSTTDVLAVEVRDKPGGLNRALQILNDAGVSVEYLYSFIKRNGERALILFRVEEPERAVEVLQSAGIKLYSTEEINNL
ncbi:amino acid-binding protein [Tepidanaerobacter syntrophicus]|uniref:ACT domain-containing protein n=1 Tax=Tepidanaerobacter syntrophicus TaxID=224999 RepID=UPI0017578CFB|nr:ACT domain-containing protein [Tepidanaerobacter syntrophicus]GLI20251.1 amino acid-binding protein [Tepidanaerobacter syntrophicus]GLI51799.1 amino acid-binding protein [Tepidanaerobacter syntrophicus]HHV83893.1 ACT domain-containing protein [Tepidanaerobacter syntrophicus]